MTAPAAPLPPTPPEAEDGQGVSRQTIVVVTAVGGGLLAASLFLSAAMPAGGPMMTIVTLGFAGGVALFIGSILGAISRRFTSGARAGFGVGAALAFILVVFVLLLGPAVATSTAPVCGVAAAGPGLFALRSFTMLRDAGV